MKIKKATIKEYYIYFLILCSLSIVKIFPFFTETVVHWILLVSTFLLFIVTLLQSKKVINRYFNNYCIYFICFYIVEFLYSAIVMRGDVGSCFQGSYYLLFLLLSPVIYSTFVKDNRWFDRLIIFIIIFFFISTLMRIAVSDYFGRTGTYIFGDIAFEFSREGWVRNGIRRIQMPSITNLAIPLLSWVFLYKAKKKWHKVACILIFATFEYYIFNVLLARSLMVYSVLIVVFMFLIKRKSSLRQMILFGVLGVLLLVLINSEFFGNFVASFQLATDTGLSGWARLVAIPFYFSKFLQNPVLGIGMITQDKMNLGLVAGDISDIGMLGFVFRYGLLGLGLYLIVFVRWINVIKKLKQLNADKDVVLALGILFSVLIFGINLEPLYPLLIFAMPFSSAIIEYLYYRNKALRSSNQHV